MAVKKVALTLPPPVVTFIRLNVVKDLRIGDVFYTTGHVIEVFYPEAALLLKDYPDCFEVLE